MEKNGKKAVVIGMAKSGIASAKLLYELGYDVTVNDMKTDIKGLKEELSGIEYKDALGVDHAEAVKGADLVVLSPVVPIFSCCAWEALYGTLSRLTERQECISMQPMQLKALILQQKMLLSP